MVRRSLLLTLLVAGAAMAGEAGSGSQPGPQGIGPGEVPAVDVEANVRKMLEEARARQGTPGKGMDLPATSSASPAPPVPVSAKPAPVSKLPAQPPLAPDDHVPVPEETITVRSVGDVKAVSRQLDEARKRQTAPEPAKQ